MLGREKPRALRCRAGGLCGGKGLGRGLGRKAAVGSSMCWLKNGCFGAAQILIFSFFTSVILKLLLSDLRAGCGEQFHCCLVLVSIFVSRGKPAKHLQKELSSADSLIR